MWATNMKNAALIPPKPSWGQLFKTQTAKFKEKKPPPKEVFPTTTSICPVALNADWFWSGMNKNTKMGISLHQLEEILPGLPCFVKRA